MLVDTKAVPQAVMEAVRERLAHLGLRDLGWRCDPGPMKGDHAVTLSFRGAWRRCCPEKLLRVLGKHDRRTLCLDLWQLSKEAEVAQ